MFDQPLRAVDIAGGFLDADDARHLGQAHHGVVGHIGHGAPRHVVQNQRQIDRLGNRFEVQVLAFLRGLVVIRNHLQLALGADLFGKARQLDGLFGGIRTAAGHDGQTPCCLLDGHADDLAMLVNGDSG